MKWFITFSKGKQPVWQKPTWFILPFLLVSYKSDTFLETGVYSPCLSISFGWLKINWTVSIQRGY
jgi:hypothetical protein